MQYKMFQSCCFVSGVSDVEHLLVLALAGTMVVVRGDVLPEVGGSEDRVGALFHGQSI